MEDFGKTLKSSGHCFPNCKMSGEVSTLLLGHSGLRSPHSKAAHQKKVTLFVDMTVPKESTKKATRTTEFSKVAGYKVSN